MVGAPDARRVSLLGGEVDLIAPGDMLSASPRGVGRRPAVIANHNAHSLFLIRRSGAERVLRPGRPDPVIHSTPLILRGRVLGLPLDRSCGRPTSIGGATSGGGSSAAWRVFYLGGAPGVAAAAAGRGRRSGRPGGGSASTTATSTPPPGSRQNQPVLDAIADFDPDILLVGMGMPLQELWALENRAALGRRDPHRRRGVRLRGRGPRRRRAGPVRWVWSGWRG